MSLPALARGSLGNPTAETVVNRMIREFNRPDRKAPIVGTDTGTGSAYAIDPTPGIATYEVGQEFTFRAAHANTTATPTLTVNGLTPGLITDLAGDPIPIGNIAAGAWLEVVTTSTVPTFGLVSVRPALAFLTATLAAPVAITDTTTWFDAASLSLGDAGIWLVLAVATATAHAQPTNFNFRLWDGAAIFNQAVQTQGAAANQPMSATLFGVVTAPAAGNVRIGVQSSIDTSSTIDASQIAAVRIG
jgi:hypothetical protein